MDEEKNINKRDEIIHNAFLGTQPNVLVAMLGEIDEKLENLGNIASSLNDIASSLKDIANAIPGSVKDIRSRKTD